MRITIRVLIEEASGQAPCTATIGTIDRKIECAPASGFGLFVGETHEILGKLQSAVLREKVAQFTDRVARCMRCRLPLEVKDSKTIVYRTAFGKARLDSPRFYSACSRCEQPARSRHSFGPLIEHLLERVHPQWLRLQSRYAVTMSYRLTGVFLRNAFPAGPALAVSSVKRNVRRIGERLDRETQLGAQAASTPASVHAAASLGRPTRDWPGGYQRLA